MNTVPGTIQIINDDIDEAQDEYFILHLALINATNPNLINITRESSLVIINDDDGWFNSSDR